MSNKVDLSIKNKVAVIKPNDPSKLNALSVDVKRDLNLFLKELENRDDVEVIVLTGSGKAFCAGGDVKGMGERTTIESLEKISNTTNISLIIQSIKKPVIAAVNGYAFGAGFGLALSCDIVFANPSTKFGLTFNKVGLIPDFGTLYFLPRIVGPWKAKELIFSGAIIDVNEAKELNIVNQVSEDVLDYAIEFAEELADGPVQTLKFVKTILNQTTNSDLKGTITYENQAQVILQQTKDHLEGIQAFKEKREPKFVGK